MPLDSAWVTRSLAYVVVGSTWDHCSAAWGYIYEQTKNRPGLIIQLSSSWFAADLESLWGVVLKIKGSWLAAAELGAHPPAILRMVAASKHKEKAVEGAARSASWI